MRIAILLLLTLASVHAQSTQVRSFSQVAPLEGNWKVTTEDDPRFAARDFDDSAWRVVRTPGDDAPLTTGITWIRARISLPETLPAEPLALMLPPLGTAYELYVNGQPVGFFGDLKQTDGWGDFLFRPPPSSPYPPRHGNGRSPSAAAS